MTPTEALLLADPRVSKYDGKYATCQEPIYSQGRFVNGCQRPGRWVVNLETPRLLCSQHAGIAVQAFRGRT